MKEEKNMGQHLSRIAALAGLAAALSLPAGAATSSWKIDPQHTSAQFAVKHLMISTVRGEFHGVNGTVNWDDKDIAKSTVDITIDATSVDTREPQRNAHLKSPDFFDVAKYPAITFKSKKVERAAPGKLKVTGDLTIRGITKEVTLDVEGPGAPIKDPWGHQRTAIATTTKINRQDFGVKWNAHLDGGGVVVGDDVNITIDLEMFEQAPAKAGN
jgi:polyisoprenoid-binding protein YceI